MPMPCLPCPWLLHAHALAAACPRGAALAAACPCLGSSMPMPWLLPWPWHAHALAALALAAACPCLGCCMPMGWLPWPWLLHTHALAACPWGGLPWPWLLHALALVALPTKEVIWAWQRAQGHARMHATPHRPALRQNWLVPFSLFAFLNSVHDFRGGFQQAVRRSDQF